MVKKYKKKPVVIEAVQWTGKNLFEITGFIGGRTLDVNMDDNDNPKVIVHTLEGDMTASKGDFIIKGVKGEFYPCKPDIFANTYEEVK